MRFHKAYFHYNFLLILLDNNERLLLFCSQNAVGSVIDPKMLIGRHSRGSNRESSELKMNEMKG